MSALDLNLSPDQQDLLRAALVSNQPVSSRQRAISSTSPISQQNPRNFMSFTPASMSDQTAPGSGHLDFSDDSPFLDFLDGDNDDSFNYDEDGRMIGDLPEDSSHNLHDKRKSIGDADDDDDEGGGKRREGDDKSSKKPGRKPLMNEPTTKRKAQNRAAQRAFRERKEKHLKDLETKVEDLEKVSESTNHENGLLKAQVERLQIELREYRKRLSWITNAASRPQPSTTIQDHNNASNNDFSFEFPKFGDLPSVPSANFTSATPGLQTRGASNSTSSQVFPTTTTASPLPRQSSVGSRTQSVKAGSISNSPMASNITASPGAQSYTGRGSSIDSLSGLFSPSILEAARHNSTGYFPDAPKPQMPMGRSSVDSLSAVPGLTSQSSTNTDSPGSNADSHQQASSIGTSPEPLFNSPGMKQDFGLNTIDENNQLFGKDDLCKQISQACGTCTDPVPPILSMSNGYSLGTQNFSTDLNSNNFDWLAQQNGGSFDPVLFGDYRETQDNVLSQDFGSFFNDAYPLPDLGSPMHSYSELPASTTDTITKPDLMKQVDAAKEGEEVVPADKGKMLTCNKIWDRLQSMEKFRNGEIDIDNLCSELRAKAKCSEGGAVVEEKHVNKLLGM